MPKGNFKEFNILVDDNWIEIISQYCWYVDKTKNHARPRTTVIAYNINTRKLQPVMYTVGRLISTILQCGMLDHIDNNPFNNRMQNLRVCTVSQNNRNKPAKGYLFDKNTNRYRPVISINSKSVYFGSYTTPEEARKAFIIGSVKYGIIEFIQLTDADKETLKELGYDQIT